jgi:hypothetical protein
MKASSFMDFAFFGEVGFLWHSKHQHESRTQSSCDVSPTCQVIPLLSSSPLLLLHSSASSSPSPIASSGASGARLDPKIYQVECQNRLKKRCQIECQNICQIKCQMECQIDCQNVCQKECQWMGITERK